MPRSSAQDKAVTDSSPSATIRRFDDDAAEKKFDFLIVYNGVGTRLGERDWNETANAFIDKIKANGELAKVYQKWMGMQPPEFPASIPNIPFTVK